MTKSRLLLAAMAAALAGAAFTTAVPQAQAQSQGYFSQRAVQDRDYSRMQAQTSRMGKSETVKVSKKKKKAKKSKSAKRSGGGDTGKSYSWQNVRGSTSPQYLPNRR